ncbi:MAG: elongation factor Ts [Chromatiales bacterium]|nr:elongation factor Ts [Chromatiales bacterium]
MTVSASVVRELRERTGVGMMECKKALVETNGDLDAAQELLRKRGQAKADKKAGRVAAEGRIELATAADGASVLVEINCETDFVAKDEGFEKFCAMVAGVAASGSPADAGALLALAAPGGGTVEEARRDLVAKVGENITVRRLARVTPRGSLGSYQHGTRIGVLVDVEGGDEDLGRDLAMHIAASKPQFLSADDVPAEMREKEREIFAAQAANEGKPPEIVAKMVEGRLRKYLGEITLLGQPFVKDPDQSVEKLLKQHKAQVLGFVRLEVGEGIEKKTENIAEAVRAMESQA